MTSTQPAKTSPVDTGLKFVVALLLCGFIALSLAGGCGCTTVVPHATDARSSSFDGNELNSGLLAFDIDGNAILTPHARDRYNALVDAYGDNARFAPRLKRDAGVLPVGDGNFKMDAEHFVYFGIMAQWKRAAQSVAPPK